MTETTPTWKDLAIEQLQKNLESQAKKVALLAEKMEREQSYLLILIEDLKKLVTTPITPKVLAFRDKEGVFRSA